MKRYRGNTGEVTLSDAAETPPPGSALPGPGLPFPPPAPPAPHSPLEALGQLLPGLGDALETEDLILLLILYLMYRESGDSELLFTMAAMILL